MSGPAGGGNKKNEKGQEGMEWQTENDVLIMKDSDNNKQIVSNFSKMQLLCMILSQGINHSEPYLLIWRTRWRKTSMHCSNAACALHKMQVRVTHNVAAVCVSCASMWECPSVTVSHFTWPVSMLDKGGFYRIKWLYSMLLCLFFNLSWNKCVTV